MGQKVNPIAFRMGINKNWNSIWFFDNKKDFLSNFLNDIKIRDFIYKNISKNYISKILIERLLKNIIITINTSKPGIIIGKKGIDIEKLRKSISKISKKFIKLKIIEIKKPELNSYILSRNISFLIEKKMIFRKIMKKSINSTMKNGALGVKIQLKGRLGGTEIARKEWYKEGKIPLHTIKANIDYNSSIAKTNYGIIGIKVWIFKN